MSKFYPALLPGFDITLHRDDTFGTTDIVAERDGHAVRFTISNQALAEAPSVSDLITRQIAHAYAKLDVHGIDALDIDADEVERLRLRRLLTEQQQS